MATDVDPNTSTRSLQSLRKVQFPPQIHAPQVSDRWRNPDKANIPRAHRWGQEWDLQYLHLHTIRAYGYKTYFTKSARESDGIVHRNILEQSYYYSV